MQSVGKVGEAHLGTRQPLLAGIVSAISQSRARPVSAPVAVRPMRQTPGRLGEHAPALEANQCEAGSPSCASSLSSTARAFCASPVIATAFMEAYPRLREREVGKALSKVVDWRMTALRRCA